MTGLLQNEEPFQSLLATGKPALHPALEKAWAVWLGAGSGKNVPADCDFAATGGGLSSNAVARDLLLRRADQSGLATLLMDGKGRVGARINLSHRSLDSVPPLPSDTKVLILAHNSIQDWTHLPEGLAVLDIEEIGITELPPNLPATLVDLNLSGNRLGASLVLPAALKRLAIGRNGLTELPRFPAGLQELLVHQNRIQTLPAGLPSGLQLLDVSDNRLTALPDDLPANLKLLLARHNHLTQLPEVLPAQLEELDVSWNRLRSLPALPDTLRVLEVGNNGLDALPDALPSGMEMIAAAYNGLRRLPGHLPVSLVLLRCSTM